MNEPGGTERISIATASVALAAGATAVLVAGVANQTIYLMWAKIYVVTAAGAICSIEDTIPTVVFEWINTTITGTSFTMYGRVPATVGAGIRIRNTSGVAAGAIAITIGTVAI